MCLKIVCLPLLLYFDTLRHRFTQKGFANRSEINDDNSIINENLNVAVIEGDDGVRVRWNKEEERNGLALPKD